MKLIYSAIAFTVYLLIHQLTCWHEQEIQDWLTIKELYGSL